MCLACARYTPTTDEKQYIGYLRKLVRQIAIVDAAGAPVRWRHPWPSARSAKKRESPARPPRLVRSATR